MPQVRRTTCQWCNVRKPLLTLVVRGRDGPFLVCTSCRELGLRIGYEDVAAEQQEVGR